MNTLSTEDFAKLCAAAQTKFSVPVPQEDMDIIVGLLVNMQNMAGKLATVLDAAPKPDKGGNHEK